MTIETWAEISARHRQEKTEAIAALAKTMTQADAARDLGITRSFVNQLAKSYGVKFAIGQRGRRSKFTDDELRQAAKSCATIQEIATKFGCGKQAIYSRARKSRIILPTRQSLLFNLRLEMAQIQVADFNTLLKKNFTTKEALIAIGREDLIKDGME